MEFIRKFFTRKPKIDWDKVRQDLEQKLVGIGKPAVRLRSSESETRCKFGGAPYINSSNFVWPYSDGKPMAFLGQIDLEEVADVHKYEWLNDKGLLLFFYDVESMPWGFDPKDKGKWSVLLQNQPDCYASFPKDLDPGHILKEKYLQPTLVSLYPNYDDKGIEDLNLSDEEIDLYIDLYTADEENQHQVGGFPSPVQGNYMELESQLASNGVYVGDSKGYASEKAKELESGSVDWRLLLQFDSDEDIDVMWGDCGMIYFWVQQQKSIKNDFGNCWLILQCC
jgi:uncharacterized protein YwqG